MSQKPEFTSLVQKMEAFATMLTPQEREIYGEILSHAFEKGEFDPKSSDVGGYNFGIGNSSLLSSSLTNAAVSSKALTRLQLGKSAAGQLTLIARGVAVGKLA